MTASLRHLERQYGPIAFGLAALLLLWFAIIAPERSQSRETASTFREAAVLLNEATKRIERIEARMEIHR